MSDNDDIGLSHVWAAIALGLVAGWLAFSGLMALDLKLWPAIFIASVVATVATTFFVPELLWMFMDIAKRKRQSAEIVKIYPDDVA